MLAPYKPGAVVKTASAFVQESIRAGPIEAKEFFRKLGHATRDIAFEIESGAFVWQRGWAAQNGNAVGIGGHILVRCGMPADFAGESLSSIFVDLRIPEIYSPIRWVEVYSNATYVLEENKSAQKEQIVRYLREASDVAGRLAAK